MRGLTSGLHRRQMRPSAPIALGVIVASALIAAGCSAATVSPEGTVAATMEASASTSTGAAGIAFGRYTVDIPEGLEAGPGSWTMVISESGIVWSNPATGANFSPGEIIQMSGNEIVFAPDPACPDQVDGPTEGRYAWSLTGSELTFTLESDSCAGRRDTLITAPWQLAP